MHKLVLADEEVEGWHRHSLKNDQLCIASAVLCCSHLHLAIEKVESDLSVRSSLGNLIQPCVLVHNQEASQMIQQTRALAM